MPTTGNLEALGECYPRSGNQFDNEVNTSRTRRKRSRNIVYRTCGYTILGSLAFILGYFVLPDESTEPIKGLAPLYWIEALAVVAFGISWLIKGETLLTDEEGP